MFDRRSFFCRSLVTGLGLHGFSPASASEVREQHYSPNDFERALATCRNLDLLGRPRSWSAVRDGLHPISPERVIILTDQGGDGWPGQYHLAHLRKSLNEELKLSAGKLDLISRLMWLMTEYYRVPHLFPIWANKLARLEALGGWAVRGRAMLHQFQDDGFVQLINPPVDWWLILFPEGIELDALDEKPVFGIISHVFPANHYQLALLTMEVNGLAARSMCTDMAVDAWSRISKLDRIAAAQEVNQAILNRAISWGKTQ